MKKIILGIALAGFLVFGIVGIQHVVATTDNVEIVNQQLDDDPDKDKKAKAKADGKTECEKKCDKTKAKCCPDSKEKCKTEYKQCKTKCADKKGSGDDGKKK